MKVLSSLRAGANFIVSLLIVIQFFDTDQNAMVVPSENAIERQYQIPTEIQEVLKVSCYDCHSNNTNYPWYNSVQPLKWLLAYHINSGKQHFNFDEFNTYSKTKKQYMLDKITKAIRNGEMPVRSYTFIHCKAKLSGFEKLEIEKWVAGMKKHIK